LSNILIFDQFAPVGFLAFLCGTPVLPSKYNVTYGDRDVKKIIGILVLLPSFVMAADVFNCFYSKADISNGAIGKMEGRTPAKVEYIKGSVKFFRPDGSYILSPPMTEDLKTIWKAEDPSKVYAMSQDFSSFAMSDRVAKVTEQWAECKLDKSLREVHETKSEPKEWKRRKLSATEKNSVENSVKNMLKDPNSARFKHEQYISNGDETYCAFVNSKNSYGGYAGDTPFMAMIMHDSKGRVTGSGVIAIGGERAKSQAIIDTCKKNGYF